MIRPSVLIPERLPKRPTKPYIPSVNTKRKSMTIALSIHAPDGIVLCSDSQLTVPQYMKYSGKKIATIERKDEWSVGLTYSGDPERMQRVCEQMRAALIHKKEVDEKYVKQCLEESLADVRSSIIDLSYESIDVLCGFARKMTLDEEQAWANKGLHLFTGKNGVVTEPVEEFSILGVGNSALSQYLEKLLSSFGQTYVTYSMALVIGAYIVEQAKKYIDGCSGDLQVCVLRSGYEPFVPLHVSEIAQIIKFGESLETILQKTIICSLGAEIENVDYPKGKSAESVLLGDIHNLQKEIQKCFWQV
jgi:20S proteasome alpha/beta subunit